MNCSLYIPQLTTLDINTDRQDFSRSLESLFNWPASREEKEKVVDRLKVKIEQQQQLAIFSQPPKAEALNFFIGQTIKGWSTAEQIYLASSGINLLAKINDNSITIGYQKDYCFKENFFCRGIFSIALIFLLQHRGHYYLHGAAFAKEERELLLIGESNSGKSTTTYQALRNGFQIVADDSLLLRENKKSGKIEVIPLYRELMLCHEALKLFPELPPNYRQLAASSKNRAISLRREKKFIDNQCQKIIPRRLIILTAKKQPQENIKKIDVLAQLIRQNPFSLSRFKAGKEEHFKLLLKLIKQVEITLFCPFKEKVETILN